MKRVLLVVLLCLVIFAPVSARRSLPATDNFNRTDGTLITGNWSAPASLGGATAWVVSSNRAQPNNAATDDAAYWNADSFNDDQYSQFVYALNGASAFIGPGCRLGSAGNGYGFYIGTLQIYKFTTGTRSNLGSTLTATIVTTDTVKMTCTGGATTTVELFQNGSSIGSRTDSSSPITSGSAGMVGYPGVSGPAADSWEGGNVGGAVVLPGAIINAPIRGGGYRQRDMSR